MAWKHVLLCQTVSCACALLAGCVTPPDTHRPSAGEDSRVVISLTNHDYDLAAQALLTELLTRLPKGYVVGLGPVDTSDTPYNVQVKTIQKALMVAFNKDGTLKFSSRDATKSRGCDQAIQDFREYNRWVKEEGERISEVNGVLCGRVSSTEVSLKDGGRQVTYVFTWELHDTIKDELLVSHNYPLTKNVR